LHGRYSLSVKSLYFLTFAQRKSKAADCRVELRRWCVLNSQLVGDSLDESEQFADNEVELRRVGGMNAAVASRDRDPAIQVFILLTKHMVVRTSQFS